MHPKVSIKIGSHTFAIGQRVRMLVGGQGCDNNDIELRYSSGDIATIIQIERYGSPQGFGIGVLLDNGIFNMFDEADDPPRYPFEPLPPSAQRRDTPT